MKHAAVVTGFLAAAYLLTGPFGLGVLGGTVVAMEIWNRYPAR